MCLVLLAVGLVTFPANCGFAQTTGAEESGSDESSERSILKTESSESESSETEATEAESTEPVTEAAEDSGSGESAGERLKAVYELTRSAKTLGEISEVIEKCDSLLAEGLSDKDAAYASQLLVWALLERVEHRLEPMLEVGSAGESLVFETEHAEACTVDLGRVLDVEPESWKAYLLRGLVCELTGDRDAALAALDRVVELKPSGVSGWFNRAELHSANRDFVLAIRDYSKALGLDPRDAQAYTGRGHAYLQMGKTVEALGDYQKLILLTEGHARAHLFRGDARLALGLWEKARDDYELGLAREPDSLAGCRRLAWLYATCPDPLISNPDLAVQLAEQAVETQGEALTWETAHLLATAYHAAGRTDEASEILDEWVDRVDETQSKTLTASRERWTGVEDEEEIR